MRQKSTIYEITTLVGQNTSGGVRLVLYKDEWIYCNLARRSHIPKKLLTSHSNNSHFKISEIPNFENVVRGGTFLFKKRSKM